MLFAKIAPFAAVAVLAEASLLLPPGVSSAPAAYASVGLLALTVGAFLLPWHRMPRRAAIAAPLLYCATALSLSLATSLSSGIGMVVFLPVVWTALFHDRWESACVVVALLAVELIVSVDEGAAAATLFRRVTLWTLLAVVISVASHALRDRARDAHNQVVVLRDELEAVQLVDDRLRIALSLQEGVVGQVFAATLKLRMAQSYGPDRLANDQIEGAITDLDESVRTLRRAVFDIEGGPVQPAGIGPAASRSD